MVGMRRALVSHQNVGFEPDHTKEYPVKRIIETSLILSAFAFFPAAVLCLAVV